MKAIISHIEYSPSKEVTFVRCKPETSFTFKEGQFMMITSDHIHPELGKQLKKPYSIATTNEELQTQGTIGFVVKKSREGFMSEYLTEKIAIGDVLHLQGPVGHMFDTGERNHYLLISVGSGLSPMCGLYKSIIEKKEFSKIVNLFGERYMKHILPSTLSEFEKSDKNTMNKLFLSKEEIPHEHLNGYVQDGLYAALEFLHTKDISVFLCGHPAMVDDVKIKLIEYGVDAKNIKAEKY